VPLRIEEVSLMTRSSPLDTIILKVIIEKKLLEVDDGGLSLGPFQRIGQPAGKAGQNVS
jgi:hypothetical protein